MPEATLELHTVQDQPPRGGSVKSDEAPSYGSMGLAGTLKTYGNATAMLVITAWISIGAPIAFFWLRTDAKDDRNEYRAQVAAERQLAEERRREDRQDRQRVEDLFRQTLETITRDSRESRVELAKSGEQMRAIGEQIRVAGEQIKAASESMIRVEKALLAKSPSSIP